MNDLTPEAATEMTTLVPAPDVEAPAEAVLEEAESADKQPAKAKSAKTFEDVDAVLRALGEQDEALRAIKQQIQDMLGMNAALRRGVKQIVQDAAKNDALTEELSLCKKKLAMVKTFLGQA